MGLKAAASKSGVCGRFSIAGLKGVGANYSQGNTIGGLPIGYVGTTGIYNHYTLSGGDNLNSGLSLVHPGAPNNSYFPMRIGRPPAQYSSTSKVRSASVYASYAVDPYHTGYLDANRGVIPTWTDSHTQSNSVLTLKQRIGTTAEQALYDAAYTPQTLNGANICTAGLIVAQPSCLLEAYVQIPSLAIFSGAHATDGAGFHFTMWTLQTGPVFESNNWEHDFEIYANKAYSLNWNKWVNGADASSGSAGSNVPLDTNWHILTFEILPATSNWYIDGVLVGTTNFDSTVFGNKPFYFNLTNETFADSYALAAWNALGNTGMSVNIGWIRVWRSTGYVHRTPLVGQASQNINFNTAFSITLPSAATVWGDGTVTDSLEVIQGEAISSSSQGQVSTTTFMPPGVTYTGGVLSGTISDRPGTLYFVRYGSKPNESCTPQRFALFIGPTILTSTLNATNGVAFSYDLYPDCECGELLPKTITCTGLPTGLSFSASTGLITGTPTVNATTPIVIGVTNSNGQTASKTVNLIVSSVVALSIDGTATNSSITSTGTVTLTTLNTNDVIILFVAMTTSTTASVLSVLDTAGLSWSVRKVCPQISGKNLEMWYATSTGAFTSNIITVTTTGSTATRMSAFGVTGAASLASPFDANASVPAASQHSGSPISETISTNHGNDMIIAGLTNTATMTGIMKPSGFSQVLVTSNTNDISYLVETSTLSSVSIAYSWTGGGQAGLIVDAIQGN